MITRSRLFEGITRNVVVLACVSLLTDLSSQMVFPLIPLYLTTVLGAGGTVVGAVEGAAETTASLLKVVSGYLSDRMRRRKPFVLLGYSLSALMKPLFAFANVWGLVLFIRIIERIGKGLRTAPRDALVAESCEECVRGKAFGFHRAADGIGSTLGAVIAYLLLSSLGYKDIFLIAFIPGVLAVLAILFVKDTCPPSLPQASPSSIRISMTELPVNLRIFVVVSALFALGHFGYAFLLLKAQDIGLADNTAILLYVLFYAVYALTAIPAGMLSDRIGRKPILMAGYLTFAGCCLGLAFASQDYMLALLFALYGMFYAMIDGAQRAFVVDMAPAHLKATALGTFHTAIGMAALPGGLLAGFLWDRIDPEATFFFGFALALVSAAMLVFVTASSRART